MMLIVSLLLDPYSVLKEGEIHFKSTKNLKDPLTDSNPRILLGDVLVCVAISLLCANVLICARSTGIRTDCPGTCRRYGDDPWHDGYAHDMHARSRPSNMISCHNTPT